MDMNGNVCALKSNQAGLVNQVWITISVFLCCVFVCVGEVPHSISGDVFIDIDDEQPLVPDQVEPAADTHKDIHTQNKYIPLQGNRQRKSRHTQTKKTTADYIRVALIMQTYDKIYTIWFVIPAFERTVE